MLILLFSDRIARSMPNLNKIRGQKKNSAGPPAGSKTGLGRGQHNYGLSSRHHNSDPRMVPGHPGSRQVQTGYNQQQQNQGVPSRGTVLSRDVRFFPTSNVFFYFLMNMLLSGILDVFSCKNSFIYRRILNLSIFFQIGLSRGTILNS